MKVWIRFLLIFCFFSVLTLLMTYPQVKNLAGGVRDVGDPLLNSWILAWNAHQLMRFDFSHYFDANIFYPYKRTLAFSEHLFPQSLLALPLYLCSGNSILAHNVLLLLAFTSSAFGMYLLAFYLTRNNYAGVLAGVIFGFSPFMFSHFSHLQVLCSGGIPLTFLFLHKFFRSESCQDLLFFTFFYTLQILANGYYAVFLSFFVVLSILIHGVATKKFANPRFLVKLALSAAITLLLAGPFFYPYLQVRRELGFSRDIGPTAKLFNYLAAPSINRLYGKLTEPWRTPEGELFPGIIAVGLACLGFFSGLKIKKPEWEGENEKHHPILLKIKVILNGLIFLWLILIIGLIGTGGFELSWGNLTLFHLHRLKNPLLTLVCLIMIRFLLSTLFKGRVARFRVEGEKTVLIYAGVLLVAFLFTFGLRGPYFFLYHSIPGFDAVRSVCRWHVFVLLSLAILAAYGVRRLSMKVGRRLQFMVFSLVFLFILAEYYSAPIPLEKMPVGKDIPEAYQWLASKKGEGFVLAELPFPPSPGLVAKIECPRMYYSTYHWAKTVNGFSGYFSPLYDELINRWSRIPLAETIRDLKELRVRLLLFHSLFYDKETEGKILEEFAQLEKDVRLLHHFDPIYVFELTFSAEEEENLRRRERKRNIALTNIEVAADVNGDMARLAIDGSLETRWNGGLQRKGGFFQVDLGRPRTIHGLSLQLGRDRLDYPRAYAVEVSRDGISWHEVARQDKARIPLTAFLKPKELPFDIFFPPVEAKLIKITLIGEDLIRHWSIGELSLYE